jgi:ATP-dependent Lon protease
MAEIGVFPLGLVLLPSERVPLHIFEPRYKELVGECIAEGGSFGVLLEDEDGRRNVGTLAGVVDVVHTFDDGRMNIVVEGRERFSIVRWTHDREYPTASVELVEDDVDESGDDVGADKVLGLFRDLAEVAGAEVEPPEPGTRSLSFEVAAHVDFGTSPKQELLELRSERARLDRLAELLDAALVAMTREREIRERASANGRVTGE